MLYSMIIAIVAGAWITAVSRKLGLPSIVLLLLGGVALGPEGLGWVEPHLLGELLEVFISLAVAVILFEGGLTLDLKGYRTAPKVIRRLLSVGVLTTWFSAAAAVHWLCGHDWAFSLLAGSLVIVTGPTVIGPLLRRIRLKDNLHHILHWEGVLIDAVGVFVALLCFEAYQSGAGHEATVNFLTRLAVGLAIGVAGGWLTREALRRDWVAEDMANVFVLANAMVVFALADAAVSEAGILAVTVAGLVLGRAELPALRGVRQFKAELTDLLIGMLFILLASRLELRQFEEFGARGALLVCVVMLVVRPLNILLSTLGSGLKWNEKAFLSWLAPRGIVAASMAALFSIHLEDVGGVENPEFLETFTFSVILATVIINGLTANAVAWLLGVRHKPPDGWIIVGAHAFGRAVAKFLRQAAGVPVLLIDTNPQMAADAAAEGLPVLHADAGDPDLYEQQELHAMGNLLALTDNRELNELLCNRWDDVLGAAHVYRWGGASEAKKSTMQSKGRVVFSGLPKPSVLSLEIASGVTTLATLAQYDAANPTIGRPLVAIAKSGIVFPTDVGAAAESRELTQWLWLERPFSF